MRGRESSSRFDPSLPILNVGCPVANGSKADAPRHNSETTLMTPTGNVAPITILLSSHAARFGGVSPQHRGMKQCESSHDKSATALPDPGVYDVSLVKPLTRTDQFGKRGHVPPLAKRCSTFAFGSYPWPLA
jgi:hypothetical protein